MRRVVRYLSVVVAITLMLTAESVSIATAAVPPLQPIPGVASVSPANGAVVGVAHPVVVTFTTPVTDRRAVERSIRISTPHNTTGHFEWVASNVVRWVAPPVLATSHPCLGGCAGTDRRIRDR